MRYYAHITGLYIFVLSATAHAYDPSFLRHNPLAQDLQTKGIYGGDDRKEFFEVDKSIQLISHSVPAFIFSNQLILDKAGQYYLLKKRPGVTICPEETFSEQPQIAFCSGFVINDKYVASAGHCMLQDLTKKPYNTGDACDKISVVFNYQLNAQGQLPSRISANDVYRCKKVVTKVMQGKEDYAVIEVERMMIGHPPLTISRDAKIASNESVSVMGYPYGLPLKIAGGATVKSNDKSTYFSTDLDTFGGNSGGPVFNTTSLINGEAKIEGILVRGATDFEFDNARQCYKAKKCTIQDVQNRECTGEDVTRISRVKSFAKVIHSRPAESLEISTRQAKVRLGEELKIDIQIPKAGYLNVLEVNPEGIYTLLYPNGHEQNNRVKAGKLTLTDAPQWKLEILSGPFGQHQLFAVLSQQPINLYQKNSAELQGKLQTFAPSSVKDLVDLTHRAGSTARISNETHCNNQSFSVAQREPCQEKPQIKATQVCYFKQASDCP